MESYPLVPGSQYDREQTFLRKNRARQTPRTLLVGPPGAIKVAPAGPASGAASKPVGGLAKRVVDLAGVAVGLVLLAPLMIAIAGLIRAATGGPAIFSQKRVGFAGEIFTCYKFRTMVADADEVLRRHLATDLDAAREWQETRKLRNDPRINCLGKILRKSSLDELPQLFNVLRGDMSLVGPRPVVPDEIAYYGSYAEECLRARPGVTGLWQTTGRNRVSYASRVTRDRYYIRRWSLRLDLILLLKTISAIMDFDKTN